MLCPPPPSLNAAATPPASSMVQPGSQPGHQPRLPPATLVACVGSSPITEATYLHWAAVAEADTESSGKRSAPNPKEITAQVMGFLISADWVIGEARDLKIHVSRARVRRRFESIRKQQFPHNSDFLRFLRETKQTVADLLLRVEINLLSERIQKRIVGGRRGRERSNAMQRFLTRFGQRWRSRTYCLAPYAVQDCAHVRSSL